MASYEERNISVFLDDFEVQHQTTDVVLATDYYPHGQQMDGRTLQQASYRYGYQGAFAEQDDETDLASFQLRQYDSRIGRWTTPDPYHQYWSPYVGMGNAPNMMSDPDGGAAHWLIRYGAAAAAGAIVGGAITGTAEGAAYGALGGIGAYAGISNAGAIANFASSNSAWLTPLTTTALRQIARQQGVSPRQPNFNRDVGEAFERVGLDAYGLDKNTTAFNTPRRALRRGRPTTIPDGVRDVNVIDSRGDRQVYPNSSFFEVKAVDGTINLSHNRQQIFGILEAARNSPGGQAGRANVTFVTTANTIIGQDVLRYAAQQNISVHQTVAFRWGNTSRVVFSPAVNLTPGSTFSPPTPSIFNWPRKLRFR